ncbi:hypothetical protein WA026_016413 [Henosepilachna vigintioctopunctata]|uniref:Uncharacterized protein n=1 Tax=Henosepilachna vigintioctopunctata TaxID=420089 RepID=A0AAW1UPY1_9CUCU
MAMSTSGSEDETANKDFDFWLTHKQLAVGQKSTVSINPICALKANPLEKCENLKFVLLALYKQAHINLNVVGTSVPCERLFLKAGARVTAYGNRLACKHFEKIIFSGSTTKAEFFHES